MRFCWNRRREANKAKVKMNTESVRKLLEGESSNKAESEAAGSSKIDDLSNGFFNSFIMEGLQINHMEPGRVVCSMKVPRRLLNTANFLHGGATASLIDLVGSAAIFSVGAPSSGVSLEINISYLGSAFEDDEIEIESKVLRVGKAIGVVNVELRKKKTGTIIAEGRHTKYLPITSKI